MDLCRRSREAFRPAWAILQASPGRLMLFVISILLVAQSILQLGAVFSQHPPAIAGSVFPRQDTVTHGNPPDLPDPGPVAAANLRRGPGGPWPDGPYTYYCGVFHTGIAVTAHLGAIGLRTANVSFAAPPAGCLRVFCYDTTAIYVCNDGPQLLAVPGFDIAWMADRLAQLCCDPHHGLSAQLFHPTAGWNTVVAYGNCRHGADEPPASFGVGNGGVNAACIAAGNGRKRRANT